MPTRFYLDKRLDKRGDAPIRVGVSVKGVRLLSTLGFNITPEKWDEDVQRVKKNVFNAKGISASVINARIKAVEAHFDQFEIVCRERPTKESLGLELSSVIGSARVVRSSKPKEETIMTIGGCLNEFLSLNGRQPDDMNPKRWSDGTVEQWLSMKRKLEEFGVTDKELSVFTAEGKAEFVRFLRTKYNLKEETAKKQYKKLLQFLEWCVKRGYCGSAIHDEGEQSFTMEDANIITLDPDEVVKLFNYQVPSNGTQVILHTNTGEEYSKTMLHSSSLEKTKDLLCFCAFTSLRYSDMAKLKREDISDGKIKVLIKKTKKNVEIALNDYSKAILDKYSEFEYPGGLALPVISNQKMNDYVKELGEFCEFNEPIKRSYYKSGVLVESTQPKYELLSTHTGRKSFVTFALWLGIEPETIMSWTGHADYEQMKRYAKIVEDKKQRAMEKFNVINM